MSRGPGKAEKHIARIASLYFKKGVLRQEYLTLIMDGRYRVTKPSEVVLALHPIEGTDLYDLSYFRCVKCGRVYNLERSRSRFAKQRKCPLCGEELVQVPIQYPSKSSWTQQIGARKPIVREGEDVKATIFSGVGKQDQNAECPLLRRGRWGGTRYLKRIVRMNRGRPLASLRWGCPFVEYKEGKVEVVFADEEGSVRDAKSLFKTEFRRVTYREEEKGPEKQLDSLDSPTDCPFLKIKDGLPLCLANRKYGSLEKSSEPVRLSVNAHRFLALSLGEYRFSLNVPMEPSFKNLQGEFYVAEELQRVVDGSDQLEPLVKEVYFSAKLKVYLFVFGAVYGHPEAPRRRRVLYVKRDREGELELWGRILETEGLILRFDEKVLASAVASLRKSNKRYEVQGLANEDLAEVVVHSVGHLLWKAMVMKTGLNYDELSESILVTEDGTYEYALYDNASGGLGGIRSILVEEEGRLGLDPDVLELASQNVACESLCDSACKACIVIPGCRRGNYDLDWRVLTSTLVNLKGAF